LAQAKNYVGTKLFHGSGKLAFMKAHGKNDFLKPAPLGQRAHDFLSDVVMKLAIGAEAVNQDAHEFSTPHY
jgi:hypothetical protein